MTIGGVSIILILGIINFLLLLVQLTGGLHIVKIPFAVHKSTGIILFITGSLHGSTGNTYIKQLTVYRNHFITERRKERKVTKGNNKFKQIK